MTSTAPGPQTAVPDLRPTSEQAGRIEAHGIDHVPEQERHGRPRELFSVWAAANVNYLCLVMGGALVLMGLTLLQAFAVIVVGNLFWALVGLLAVSGPVSGTPSSVITRTMYGIRGNRVNTAITGWAICLCYVSLNLSAAAIAAFSLLRRAGIEPDTGVKIVTVAAIAAFTLAISVYGHATILKLYLPITLVLVAVFAVVGVSVLRHAHWDYTPAEPLHGGPLWASLLGGFALVASGPLSFNNGADFARYLPPATSPKQVAGWTALGGFVPSVVVTALGTLAGTAIDMTDPQTALEGILPGWFTPVFLVSLVVGAVAINAMTTYSSGLALQAVGIRIRRSLSVVVYGLVAVALTLYALLVSDFLDTVSNVLQLTVVLLGPGMAVYATDILLRRNRYDGPALMDETPNSAYWYTGGVNRAGVTALVTGTAAAVLCVSTELYTGPLARAAGGLDLALPVGMPIAAAVHAILMRRHLPSPASRAH
ncbi:cytosine permease [Streptomyces sp. sk2.1]|uniref:purine-cytosine permease family protein n=1 Tax=Streptomyces sp. sk2.1 TaxID=2478959 RepID=UPI0011E73D22|nr:cytosine permease [Streptomyces sp. sk2.1]TXS64261.1 nitrate reductase [Streptomyces sp. sk2.1]